MYSKPGFLDVIGPLIDEASFRLRAGMAELQAGTGFILPPYETLAPLLFGGVRDHLERIITPTLALELNVARLRGELRGDTPEARHAHFVERLSDAELQTALAGEYPVMFRLVAGRLDTWVRVSLELLTHLSTDWDDLAGTFFDGRSPGLLSDVRFPQRSTKRGGRAVVLLGFTSGERLVYKPRSLAVELRFQELLEWLNLKGFEPEFRPITVLDRGTYGWMGWIDPATCETVDEVGRFYRRQGAYLALFYALEATDLHMSNVIAAGENPALIDLETLFHPRDGDPNWPALDLAVDDAIYYSVLRPGLLPEPETADEGTPDRLDQSGLVGAGGQRTPYAVPTWRGRGTDAMRLDRARKTISGSKNRPTLRGRAVDPFDYLGALGEGFTDAYRLMMLHRDELLIGGGPLSRFAGVQVRVLPRSGRHYGDILEQSFHPDLLRDAEARPRFLSAQLRRDTGEDADSLRLMEYELADLDAGDTPLFTTHVGSQDIVSGRDEIVAGYFPLSGLEMARRRVAALDEADLACQRWFIRAAFATVADNDGLGALRPIALPNNPATDMRRRAIDEAKAIGERLADTAVRAGQETSWVGLEPDEYDHWSIEPLGAGLAHGLAGVALFLHQLFVQTNEPRFRELAGAAVATILRVAAEDAGEPVDDDEPIGLFDGVGGRLWALSRLAASGDYPGLDREIGRLVAVSNVLLGNPVEDEDPGPAFGLAGSLIGLLAAHEVFPESGALEAARLAGDLLLDRLPSLAPVAAVDAPFAMYYEGLAGAVGPMMALAELNDDNRHREAAESLLATLLAAGTADAGAWRAYLSARPWLSSHLREWGDGRLPEAMPSVAASEYGRNHSMVYGDMGILDLLLSAAEALGDDALFDLAGRFATAVMTDIDRGGLRPAVPLQVESPGWATGLAGIGYVWLRFAAPEKVAAFGSILARQGVR